MHSEIELHIRQINSLFSQIKQHWSSFASLKAFDDKVMPKEVFSQYISWLNELQENIRYRRQ